MSDRLREAAEAIVNILDGGRNCEICGAQLNLDEPHEPECRLVALRAALATPAKPAGLVAELQGLRRWANNAPNNEMQEWTTGEFVLFKDVMDIVKKHQKTS